MDDYDSEDAFDSNEEDEDFPLLTGTCAVEGCDNPVIMEAGGVSGADFDFCEQHAEPGVMR